MKYLPGVFVLLSIYLGVRVLSSKLSIAKKIMLNLALGVPAVFAFNLIGKHMGTVLHADLFTFTVIALCGPAGLTVLLAVRLIMMV